MREYSRIFSVVCKTITCVNVGSTTKPFVDYRTTAISTAVKALKLVRLYRSYAAHISLYETHRGVILVVIAMFSGTRNPINFKKGNISTSWPCSTLKSFKSSKRIHIGFIRGIYPLSTLRLNLFLSIVTRFMNIFLSFPIPEITSKNVKR